MHFFLLLNCCVIALVGVQSLVLWVPGEYGKLGRYFRTSSSAKWAKRSINSIFHLFIQFQWEKLLFSHWNPNKQMENWNDWSFCTFVWTWGSEILAKFSILPWLRLEYTGSNRVSCRRVSSHALRLWNRILQAAAPGRESLRNLQVSYIKFRCIGSKNLCSE